METLTISQKKAAVRLAKIRGKKQIIINTMAFCRNKDEVFYQLSK